MLAIPRKMITISIAVLVSVIVISWLGSCGAFQRVPCHSGLSVNRASYDAAQSQPVPSSRRRLHTSSKATSEGDRDDDEVDYSADPFTAFLGRFLPVGRPKDESGEEQCLVFNANLQDKRVGLSTQQMASALDEGLRKHSWFVTGKLDASLFSEEFSFTDPQVSLRGVDKYAKGVYKLFDQNESRCDVISTKVEGDDIVVRWRLAGRLNLPFRPPIKPYVVVTTFERDSDGLLETQRDEFTIADWDILLHAVFPGHPFGAEPAPPVEPSKS